MLDIFIFPNNGNPKFFPLFSSISLQVAEGPDKYVPGDIAAINELTDDDLKEDFISIF